MNLIKFDHEIQDFKTRVIQTFRMKSSSEGDFTKYKTLCRWIYDESQKFKRKDDSKGIMNNKFIAGMMQKIYKGEQDPNLGLANDLKTLSTHIRNRLIPKTFNFQCKSVPSQILTIVKQLKDKKWENYYCEVRGPFLQNRFICKKQDFHSNIEQVKVNGLKVLIIEQKVAHRYQRNLIQQIFGRVFRSKGSLSMVIKLEVNHDPLDIPYYIYCYIEDRNLIDQDQDCKSLSCVKQNGSQLEIQSKGSNIEIDELNVLQLFLSQILVLPVQSLVSNFIVRTHQQKQPQKIVSEIIKCNQQDQKEIIQDRNLREHPSLRNPLLYFSTYLRDHKIKITEAQKISSNKELYACFYKSLEIVIKLIQTDFETHYEEFKINSSICFNLEVFTSLWAIFHKIGLLEEWMTEVIQPIKNNITISEVISHFCPILNQISVSNNDSFTFGEYKDFYSNVEIQSYLGSAVSKKALQKYKDIFLNETQIIKNRKYTSAPEIYNQIFKPVLNEVNLKYLNPIEVSYILYFYCKYRFQYKPSVNGVQDGIQAQWKDISIWERCIKFNQNHELHFIDIAFDMLGYACGVNVFLMNDQCFEKVKYFEETEASLKGVDWFVDFIRENYQKQSVRILSSLLQKSLKYRKFQTCKIFFSKKVRIRNFRQILHFYEIFDQSDSQTREALVKIIQQDSPQMHRLFKWQENIWIHLKKQTKDSIAVESLDCETLYIPKDVLETHIKNGKIINNLSRKDSRFDSNREIALVSFKNENGKNIQFYIEITQYPLMIYFYRSLFQKLGIPEIMPYFTSFFYENRLIHIFEHLQNALNYKKGLSGFKEQEMHALTDQSHISEAIILSLIVLPSKIQSNDIIICPNKATHDQIFVIDWQSFYCKDFMSKYIGKPCLNSQNCLFLMDKMNKLIDKNTLNKYSNIEIDKIAERVLKECKLLNKKVHKLKNEYCQEESLISNPQLLAHIFEQGFIFNLCERMHKISRIFRKKQTSLEKGLSFFRLFEIISSSTCYFYQQVHNSGNNLLAREKILANQDWKRSFLQTSLVQFFGSFQRLPQVQNSFPLYYNRFCFQGPTQNLFEASTTYKKLSAFIGNKLPENLIQFNNVDFEYYMKNCDLTEMDSSNKEKIMQIIKSKSKQYLNADEKRVLPLSYVSFKNTQFFKDRFNSLNFSFERVQQMLIQSCKFGQMELNNFPRSVQNILYLSLKDITGLRHIGENVLNGKAIQIKHLKTLSIIDCNDLISIDLKCDILQNLQLRNNRSLENMYIFSNNLKNIYIYNNPSLNFESLAIFVIKGINVLICKSSCHGDFMKIYHENYEVYLAYVLRYLLVRFCQSPDSRQFVMLGLLKMREVDGNLITMGGFSNYKAISTVFNKFTTEIEDKILIELMRIYSSNPYRKKISIADLTQTINVGTSNISVQRIIRLISEALLKTNLDSKHINKIQLENTRQFFTKANVANINNMIDRLKIDKNFTVELSQITNQSDNQEVKATAKREIEVLRKISIDKSQIQKVSLIFKQSKIQFTYLDKIFHNTQSIDDLRQTETSSNRQNLGKSDKSYRQTLNEQNQKYMKISNLVFENCQIENDRTVDLSLIEDHLKNIGKKVQEEHKGQQEIEMQQIFNDKNEYTSVKSLKIKNCVLENYDILGCIPKITSLSIHKSIFVKKSNKFIKTKSQNFERQKNEEKRQSDYDKKQEIFIQKYKQLFKISSKLELHTLDLKHFFTLINSTGQLSIVFDLFCESLSKMKKLKTLKLNNNYFSLENLKKLDQTLNKTTIEELQLYTLELPIYGNHNSQQVSIQSDISEDPKQASIFSNTFTNTKNLKSLAIQLNNHQILKQFITSISINTSLIELKLNTNCIITSSTLKPLNQNTTLSLLSSNVQLPVWLINHLANNGKNIRKQLSKQYISEENQNLDSSPINIDMSMSMSGFKNNDYFRIGLSLDGGGMRGMLLASELHYLATRVGYPLHKIFDCIGGTSIGGILALASTGTYDGMNPVADTEQLMALFSKYGKDIFKKTQIMQLKNLFDTKYSVSSFEGVLKNYFKDCRLANCLSETNVIVTAVNRVDNKDYIFKSTEALLNRDKDFYMRDVGRATSAAPTYFPSAEIKNVNASLKLSLIDGGVGMNNPSKLVIDDVKKIAANSGTPDNYFLLSLGTGKLPNEVIPEFAGLKDIAPIIDSFTDAAANFVERDMANNYKGHFFRVSPLINLALKKDGELDNTNDSVIETYRQTGLEAAKKNFENTVIFGKYRNMNLIEWLRENTVRKYEY